MNNFNNLYLPTYINIYLGATGGIPSNALELYCVTPLPCTRALKGVGK